MAEAFGVLPPSLITADCADAATVVKIANKINSFFMRFGFVFILKKGLTPKSIF
jgi:hypothetical protein